MLDYRGLEALITVIETQSFDIAANKLFITQSAVSQRIKNVENYYGEPLLIRNLPYRPTHKAELLLGHFKRVTHLEQTLTEELTSEVANKTISIAINRDSLETWFMEVILQLHKIGNFNLEIISDDQEVTIDYLKKGLVTACLSTSKKPITT